MFFRFNNNRENNPKILKENKIEIKNINLNENIKDIKINAYNNNINYNNIINDENNFFVVRHINPKESKNSIGYGNDSYIRNTRKEKDLNEKEEKKAVWEILYFIKYKFNNNKENFLEENFNLDLNLNIPYKVN